MARACPSSPLGDNHLMTTFDPRHSDSAPLPVIAPQGDFDLDSLAPLRADIEAAATQHGGVILDASRITFADSTFLRLIITTHHDTDLRIAAPSAQVERLLNVVGADAFLRLYPTIDAALTS